MQPNYLPKDYYRQIIIQYKKFFFLFSIFTFIVLKQYVTLYFSVTISIILQNKLLIFLLSWFEYFLLGVQNFLPLNLKHEIIPLTYFDLVIKSNFSR